MVVVITALAVSGCSDDGPDPIPATSGTADPDATAPGAPTLNGDQRVAYDAALSRYTEFQAFAAQLSQQPEVGDETASSVAKYMTLDGADSFSKSLDQLVRNDAHVEGTRDVAWSVPVRVTDTSVVLRQCETPGSWVLVGKDGSKVPQSENTITEVVLEKVERDWFVDGVKGAGTC